MSTNINISVGDNKLLDQARLQQNASRQAQLEKEANKRLKSEAEINRVNALAAQGKDVFGNSFYGTPTPNPQIDRRPAANRFDQFDFGEGYFRVTRGTNNIAIATVRSGDKQTVITVNLTGSERPEGFRDKTGVDKLPALPGSTAFQPYLVDTGATQIRHVGYSADGIGGYVQIDASGVGTGGWAQFESSVVSSDLIVLPITASTAVFAYSEQRHSYKTYTYHQEVFSRDASNLGSVAVTEFVPVAESREDITKAAFLVSYNSVKQISYPDNLYQAARQVELIPPFTLAREDLLATGMESFISWNDPPITGLRQAFTGIGAEYTLGNVNYTGLQQIEIISWGLKRDETLFEIAEAQRVSPGIYDALKGASIPFYSYPDNPRFADVKEQVNVRGQKFTWFRVKYDIEPGVNKAQIYTEALPEYYSPNGGGSLFEETSFADKNLKGGRTILAKQVGETYYRWTDWNDRSYCRSQATALGFSSFDLTP